MPDPKLKTEHYSNFKGMNPKSSNYMYGEGESIRIQNMDFTTPGAWTKVPGTTLYNGATVAGSIGGIFQFTRLSGASYLVVSANTNIYTVDMNFTPIRSGLLNEALFDFVPFVDRLFCANGQDFFKTDGVATSNYSLPPGATGLAAATGAASGFTGYFQYAYGYLNDRGYAGPVGNFVGFSTGGNDVDLSGFSYPAGFGITAILIYRSENDLTADVFQIGSINPPTVAFTDTGFTLSTSIQPPYIYFTLAPRYIEIFNNQLFMAGFSSLPSTAYFSDIGEPEGVGATASFEVRTNDGDRITGMRAYNGALVMFKQKSFSVLSGDNPNNFTLQERSDQYGCLSNRANAIYDDRLLFLDRKGIVEFNGANIQVMSTNIEPLFLRMNIAAAIDNAAMLHVKERNEIWTLFPIDGATMNNQLVVFDYYANAWYERKGLDIRTIAQVQAYNPYPSPFYGGYTGSVFNFGATLYGDNGAPMECSVKTRFHKGDGFTTESMFRRLWLDVSPLPVAIGGTAAIAIDFFANMGLSAPVLSREMYGATWQSRIDFGISAKSLAFEFTHTSASQPLQINGYGLAHRYQRDV